MVLIPTDMHHLFICELQVNLGDLTRGSATGGTGGHVPPFFRMRGIIPHFQENSGPNPLSFRLLVWVTL